MNPSLPPAQAALAVFAVAPQALGGVRLRARAGPERDSWLDTLRLLLPEAMPWRRMPAHIGDEALLGGLDLAATLAAGRPVAERGLLAQAEGGIVVAAMAERIAPGLAARLNAALDGGPAGLALIALDEGVEPDEAAPAALDAQAAGERGPGIALVALDEGADDDEAPPPSLLDRLALHVQPEEIVGALPVAPQAVAAARAAWRGVSVDDALLEALVGTAAALGADSARAAQHALCATRVIAALDGRAQAGADDAALAARLVLAPRATRLPPAPASQDDDEAAPPEPPPEPPAQADDARDDDRPSDDDAQRPLDDQLIEAAQAAIPPGLLALIAAGLGGGPRRGAAGRVGQASASRQRGRPIGSLRGQPRGGARLALIDTLRAAAPWQRVRAAALGTAPARVIVAREDLRIQRRVERRATATVFAIDASGSQAMHRLGEAKGAVELLLADCYARRDRVAVIGFRGQQAQVLLAPTRSLVRAKRQLAGLPGGGGTPLAAGIDAAHALALAVRRSGATPLVVLLTDGRANVARDGSPGREAAQHDAQVAARALAASGIGALLIDTSAQPGAAAAALAAQMGARCVALPHAQAQALSQVVRQQRDVARA